MKCGCCAVPKEVGQIGAGCYGPSTRGAKEGRYYCHKSEKGDYLTLREQLFAQETVKTLYEKVRAYQQGDPPPTHE